MMDAFLTEDFVHCTIIHLCICGIIWVLVIGAVFLDLWDRVYTNKKLGKEIKSHRIRETIDKFTEYWRFLLIAFIIDMVMFIVFYFFKWTHLPFVSMALFVLLLIIEGKSLFEHAKERKSELVEMKELINIVVNAATDKDAKKAIKDIGDYLDKSRSK